MLTDFLRTHMKATSQAALARRLNVDPSLISHWMAGRLIPSPSGLDAFLDLVQATADQRAEAWNLLAEADRARKAQPERDQKQAA